MDFPNYQLYVQLIAQQNFWMLVIALVSAAIVFNLLALKLLHPEWLRIIRPLIVAFFIVTLI